MVRSAGSIPEGPFFDWLPINGTCQHFRSLGKAHLFSEKTFIISPALLRNLEEKKVRILTVADTNRALSLITSVNVPISPVGAGSSFLGLERYQRLLPRLHTLKIQPRTPESAILHALNSKEMGSHTLPETLTELLTGIGLDLETIRTCLLYRNDKVSKQEQIACLQDHVYPFLRILADRKAKTKA